MQRKRLLGWLAFAAAAAAAVAWLPRPDNTPEREAKAQAPQAGGGFAALPRREAIDTSATPLFAAPAPQAPRVAPAAQAPVTPSAPPMPYRVAGSVFQEGAQRPVLARGDAVLAVREGDTLDGVYRVEAVTADLVTLVYLPLGQRYELPVNSALAIDAPGSRPAVAGASGPPATLSWDGPQRVSAGSTFRVALKLTSSEAVRAAPLQLSFDAAVVRPIAVRAGQFFSDGMFSYRVNPAGSIFIGASGKGAVPSDAEVFVVNFEPIRPSGTAEFTLSSLNLQNAAGRSIAYQPPVALRTTITR